VLQRRTQREQRAVVSCGPGSDIRRMSTTGGLGFFSSFVLFAPSYDGPEHHNHTICSALGGYWCQPGHVRRKNLGHWRFYRYHHPTRDVHDWLHHGGSPFGRDDEYANHKMDAPDGRPDRSADVGKFHLQRTRSVLQSVVVDGAGWKLQDIR